MEIINTLQNLPIQPVSIAMTIGVCVFLGAFWYSPKVFGDGWAKAQFGESAQMKGNPLQYLGAILVSSVMVFCIALLIASSKIGEIPEGMLWAFISWLGFIATSHFSGVIWAKKPIKVYIVDVSYLLIAILISTTLLIIWKK